MSHILFVTPYYPPEVGAAQTRVSETAARLVKRGHRVTVLTTLPNYPSGVVPPEYRGGKRRREVADGVLVVRIWSYIRPNKGFLGRILAQLSFGCLAGLLGAASVDRPDIIIVESPPLFDAVSARILCWLKRCPYIFTVADIWPESAVQLGAVRNRLAIWLAHRLEWSAYQRAGAIWTVTAGIRRTLTERGLPPERLFLVPNGVDTARFLPLEKTQARAELGWDSQFRVVYVGTLGLAHGLTIMLDAAAALRDQTDIRLVLIGEGATKANLMAEAIKRGLINVEFVDAQPHDRMPLLIASADACLVSLRKLPLFEGALPSKMYEAMASARPILLAVDGEARHLVAEQARAAIYVEPENSMALANAILLLRDRPELAEELGQHGRSFVEAHFDRDKLTAQLERQIAAVLDRTGHRHTLAAMEHSVQSVPETQQIP